MLLLDTHTLIWFINDDEALSPKATQLITQSETVLVSIASLWEISIKLSIGKLSMGGNFDDLFPTHLIDNGLKALPISLVHLSKVEKLPFHHRDPFDRLIIAQSLADNIPVVGVDQRFDDYGVTRLW